MIGTIQELSRTKAGKPKLKIDGKWVFAGRTKVEGLQTGSKIEYTTTQYTPEGSDNALTMLESWKPFLNGDGKPAHGPSDDAEMRFISNCVGQAIAAGTIKSPSEIRAWFVAAKAALKPQDELDDDLPDFT